MRSYDLKTPEVTFSLTLSCERAVTQALRCDMRCGMAAQGSDPPGTWVNQNQAAILPDRTLFTQTNSTKQLSHQALLRKTIFKESIFHKTTFTPNRQLFHTRLLHHPRLVNTFYTRQRLHQLRTTTVTNIPKHDQNTTTAIATTNTRNTIKTQTKYRQNTIKSTTKTPPDTTQNTTSQNQNTTSVRTQSPKRHRHPESQSAAPARQTAKTCSPRLSWKRTAYFVVRNQNRQRCWCKRMSIMFAHFVVLDSGARYWRCWHESEAVKMVS